MVTKFLNSSLTPFLALLILLPLSSFFSGSEVAIFSITRLHLKRLMAEGRRNVSHLSYLHHHPEKTLSAILLGNTLVNVGASFFATLLTLRITNHLGFSEETGTTIAIVGMTFLLLIFGEFSPKLYAAQRKEEIALWVSPILKGFLIISSPLLSLFQLLLHPLQHIKPKTIFRTKEELKTMIDLGLESQVLKSEETRMIRRVFDLAKTQVKEVMTPRVKGVALPSTSTVKDAIQLLKIHPYSRIPVFQETLDHIVGILYTRDLLPYHSQPHKEISTLLRPSYLVTETMKVGDFFTGLEKNSSHIGIVVDEYGGTSGLVTLDDLLEEVVGEILEGEESKGPPLVSPLGKGEARVLGSIDIHHLNELLNLDLPSEFAVTLAGFLYDLAGKIPSEGEIYSFEGTTFTIEEVVERRIVRVKVEMQSKRKKRD